MDGGSSTGSLSGRCDAEYHALFVSAFFYH